MRRTLIVTLIACGLAAAGAAGAQQAPGPPDPADRKVERIVIRDEGPEAMQGLHGMAHRMAMRMGWQGRQGRPGLHRGPGGWGPGALQALSLSDDQRDQLRDIRDRQARRGIQARADLSIARLDLHRLLGADKPEAGAINAQIDKLARMRAELAKSQVATMLEMRAVLTAEQQKQLHERRLHPGGPRHGGPGGQGEDEDEDDRGDLD